MTRLDWWIGVAVLSVALLAHAFIARERQRDPSPAPSSQPAWVLWSGFKSSPKDAWLWEIDEAFPVFDHCVEHAKAQFAKRETYSKQGSISVDSAGLGFEVWPAAAIVPFHLVWRCLPDTVRPAS